MLIALLAIGMLGCRSATNTTIDGATGAGVGALAGAVVGSRVKKPLEGAAIGGAAGGVIGGAAGAAKDIRQSEEERTADEHYQQALAVAMRNDDVLQMLADGQSEVVILSSIEKAVTNFDLSPSGLATLKSAGASDTVIIAMQNSLHVRRPVTLKSVMSRPMR